MASDYIDVVCTGCWGKRFIGGKACAKCRGSGENPTSYIPLWAKVCLVLIFFVGTLAVWSTEF